ncbi:MAG: hemolysin family protein [Acholeplasma sp.]|nr:hemolysin family protein [Acholeplasma sp.]
MDILYRLILIIILVVINAFFAGSEAALVAANEIKVKNDAENGNKKAKLTLKYINNSTNFLSTIQVGITFIGFINGFLAAESFTLPILELLGDNFVNSSLWQVIVKIVITLILTYLQVVFGELVPKKIAIQKPEKFIYRTVGFLNVLNKFMRPLVMLLTKSANGMGRLLGVKEQKDEITEDELRMLVVGSGDALKEREKQMIENVLDFDDRTASDVMTHRTEVFALDIETPYDEMLKLIKKEQYSRVPVYSNSIDNIVGILHIKDLLTRVNKNNLTLEGIIRKPFFVPESMKTSDLFKEMQRTKNHMAIVIDEFGGTSGIVSIEDLLEEIVGNIFDEYDDVKEEVTILKDNCYVIDGLANIDDIEDIINVGLPVDEYDTVSGFILDKLGRFPLDDENVEIIYNGYKYEVLEINDRVIEKIKITKIVEDETESDE